MESSQSNFCYPVKVLENDRVKLVPFDPAIHQQAIFDAVKDDGEKLFKFLPYGPFSEPEGFTEWFKGRIVGSKGEFLYAALVKTAEGSEEFAGTIGLLESNATHEATEIGFVLTVSKFQRTHVTTNMIGLLLKYTLDPPPQGLGLRRVQWQAHASNEASIHAATRMGFTLEGIIRWQRKLPPSKLGSADVAPLAAQTGKDEPPGRHSAQLSICWDDWLVKRENICRMMER